jgi:hypothetical protein
MLLWLAEVAGVPKPQVRDADRALRRLVRLGLPDSNPRCGMAVRSIIPWRDVEAALLEAGYLKMRPRQAGGTGPVRPFVS